MTKRLEVHRHSFITGPRANRGQMVIHSHEGGDVRHQHEHTGPAVYTIDKDEWFRATGLKGGGRKKFTAKPTGEQLPLRDLEEWQVVIHESRTGIGATERIALAFRRDYVVEHMPRGPRPKRLTGGGS